MAEYEEVIAEVEVDLDKIKLSNPRDPMLPLFMANPPDLVPDGSSAKLVLRGILDTDETETYEQAAERTRDDAGEDSQEDWHPSALAERMRPKERYVLRGSLQVTSLTLELIG